MTTTTKTETGSYNFPSSLPTEDGMETLRKIMDEVEAIFFNSPMNENQRVSYEVNQTKGKLSAGNIKLID